MTYSVGDRLYDGKRDRTVVLERRVDPVGLTVLPYWVVRNVQSGRVTVILERRLDKARWTEVEDEPVADAEVEL